MTAIEVQCPAGHPFHVGMHLRGETVPCQQCQSPVTIPWVRDPLSDTGVMRILAEAPPSPPASLHDAAEDGVCPRCQTRLSQQLTVCPHCHGYIEAAPDYMRRLG